MTVKEYVHVVFDEFNYETQVSFKNDASKEEFFRYFFKIQA